MDFSSKDLIEVIKRYQNCIQKINPAEKDPKRVIHYIRKLAKLPIRYEELEATGIGKTINSLSKSDGKVAEAAIELVTEWREIARRQCDEEEAQEQKCHSENHRRLESNSPKTPSPPHYANNVIPEPVIPEHGGDFSGISRDDDDESSPSKNKVHLITIKRRGSHHGKRKHSDEGKDGKTKKEKRKKIENQSQQILDKQPEVERVELEPCICPVSSNPFTTPVNIDVGFVERRESTGDKKKKDRKNDRKSPKKSHEKRHHKSSKHKEEKSHRESKHHHDSEHRSQLDEDVDSHKHKRLKKSKIRDRDRNHTKKNRKLSDESSEADGNCQNSASHEITNHQSAEVAGDIFGAALLGIPVAAISPKKKITPQTSNQQDSPSTSSSKSNHSINFLSKSVKLEPLSKDLDISEVPDYAAGLNRTPPKLNSTIKIEVPSTSLSQSQKTPKPKMLSEEDMFSSMVLMKNRRTKVYHGFKVNSEIPTLFALCVRVLQDHFDALEYTGGVPYTVLKTILEKVTAEQLYTFENYNPYLIGETDELWEFHSKKHFRTAERQEYETWRDLYLRCVEEREEKLHSLTENISQSMANSTPVRKTKLAYVDAVVKPPRNVARQQAKHGTGSNIMKKSLKEPLSAPAVMSVKERLAKEACSLNAIQIPSKAVKKKAAPLMQKTLQLFKGLKR